MGLVRRPSPLRLGAERLRNGVIQRHARVGGAEAALDRLRRAEHTCK
jgi:hypothetical protein